MAAGELKKVTNVTVDHVWCPPAPQPCLVTFGNTGMPPVVAMVSGDRMLSLLLSDLTTSKPVTIEYREAKPSATRVDLLVDVKVG